MNTPLDIAVDIGRILAEMQEARTWLDLSARADELFSRFPAAGVSRGHIVDALREEASAIGVAGN